jgi:hypothetical protein
VGKDYDPGRRRCLGKYYKCGLSAGFLRIIRRSRLLQILDNALQKNASKSTAAWHVCG